MKCLPFLLSFFRYSLYFSLLCHLLYLSNFPYFYTNFLCFIVQDIQLIGRRRGKCRIRHKTELILRLLYYVHMKVHKIYSSSFFHPWCKNGEKNDRHCLIVRAIGLLQIFLPLLERTHTCDSSDNLADFFVVLVVK